MAANDEVLDVDTLLCEHLGQFGKFQIRTLGLIALLTMFVSFCYSTFIFTTARLSSRCYIPECDVGHSEFSSSWILNAVPGSNVHSLEPCSRYKYINIVYTIDNMTDSCPPFMFDRTETMKCDHGIVYHSNESIVYDFNLGCNDWQRSIIGTAKSIATLISTPFMGILGDRIGRKTVVIFNLLGGSVFGIIRYWASSYDYFIILEIIESLIIAECFSCCYVLAIELVGPDYRDVAGSCVTSLISLGNSLLSFIAWSVPNWRNLTLAVYCPQIIIIAYYWLMPESLRWLINKKKYEKAEVIIKMIAKTNKKHIPDSVLEQLKKSTDVAPEKELTSQDKCKEPGLIKSVFRKRTLLLRCILVPIWWITNNFIHQGLEINAVNLSGNKYLNFMIVAFVDLPAIWSATLFMKKIGRRTLIASCYFICALCQIAQIFIDTDFAALSLSCYLFGKYTIAVAGNGLLVYTAELFPTKYRQSLFGYVSTIGRLGSIVAPLTPSFSVTIWPNLPLALYAGLGFLSSSLTFFTPETKGIKLPDTIEDII